LSIAPSSTGSTDLRKNQGQKLDGEIPFSFNAMRALAMMILTRSRTPFAEYRALPLAGANKVALDSASVRNVMATPCTGPMRFVLTMCRGSTP
jgi:hypothetical protein